MWVWVKGDFEMKPFERFAPAVLQIYHRDKEALWAAVMAPFLSDRIPLPTWVHHIKFMLSLERSGKAALIDEYWEAFLLFSAVVQNLDDWTDLKKDLNDGHYSYVTLGAEKNWDLKNPKETAKLLREDNNRVQEIYNRSEELLRQSRSIFTWLNDPCLIRLVDLVELRFDSFCRKKLKMTSPNGVIRYPLQFSSGASHAESYGI
jgi:hypothetical protein